MGLNSLGGTMSITAQEARALRHADTLCFDHLPDGTGQIRAIRRADHSTSGFEETVTITLNEGHSRVDNYGPDNGPWTGYASMQSAKYDDRAQTLVRHIRAGSEVAFRWTR